MKEIAWSMPPPIVPIYCSHLAHMSAIALWNIKNVTMKFD